ncbi:MAG: trypsin-like peptidase domain-containing protein [Pirellulales bacterium]|nr:trypsin-like peptidase domain-containing protein [Pirellulales bacterium]
MPQAYGQTQPPQPDPQRNPTAALPQRASPQFPANPTPAGSFGYASAGAAPGMAGSLDDELTAEERVNIAVYENVNRSVVNITTQSVRGDRFFWMEIPSEGEGSGAIIDRQGHVLTNFHVVDGARAIQVTLFTGKSYDAELVGQDPTNDVAVLKIEAPAEDLFPVVFGDSTRLRVGQRVFAIGNPFGLERTLTTGIISSLNRSLPSRRTNRTIKQIIQIDAAINPGNSGGPLLDSRSRMIGINTAIASRTGESAGVGFAIPINTIARVVPQLIRNGRVLRPEIGIAKVLETEEGLLIATLLPGGAAEKAGLRGMSIRTKRQGLLVFEYLDRSAADLIVAVDGEPAKNVDDFLSCIESRQPGDQVAVTVVRDGRKLDVPVRLEMGE